MNWDAIGVIAEVVAASGVIITLIYLAFQVRQNTSALKVSTHQDLVSNQIAAMDLVGGNPQVAELLVRADEAYDEMTAAERKQYSFYCLSMFNVFQSARFNYEAGLLNEEIWKAWVRGYASVLVTSPGVRKEWAGLRELYTPNIRAVVDDIIAQAEPLRSTQSSTR